jgi:hypothetical protein
MTAPVVTIVDHDLHFNTWAQIKFWLSYSDADGDAPVEFQFWDANTASDSGYFWTPGLGQLGCIHGYRDQRGASRDDRRRGPAHQ